MSSGRQALAKGLASALLAGDWRRGELLFRASDALGFGGLWLRHLVHDVMVQFPRPPHDARDSLAAFILRHEQLADLWSNRIVTPRLRRWYFDQPRMRERRWPVRPLDTLAELRDWLDVPDELLAWLADRKGFERFAKAERLQNYRYRWVTKRSGGARLLESPKSRLKALQRRILTDVLEHIPPHPAAHGFRQGRSIITHAMLHVRQQVVIRFDLRAFFADIHPARAFGLFRGVGYPEEVSRTLVALCTNRVPLSVLSAAPQPANAEEIQALFFLRQQLREFHLPQGAPTSPALANLCAHGLDLRLTAAAKAFGATYSRYADDLTFSGDRTLAHGGRRLERRVAEIARDLGFSLNRRKTAVMPASSRQAVTGLVVNERLNLPRRDFDNLKATLTNCVRHGPASQARGRAHFREHLLGKLAWVEHLSPARGEKLRRLYEQIVWPSGQTSG
jgi:hypothetical protein